VERAEFRGDEAGLTRYGFRVQELKTTQGCVIWLTGLSGAGKSTIAIEIAMWLNKIGVANTRLDGDIVREGLCSDLGFTPKDRKENVRRFAEVAALMEASGLITVVSMISPYKEDRALAKKRCGRFLEVYVETPIDICERRDPKGLYKRARAGQIKMFTGISAPYEEPSDDAFNVQGHGGEPREAAENILNRLEDLSWL